MHYLSDFFPVWSLSPRDCCLCTDFYDNSGAGFHPHLVFQSRWLAASLGGSHHLVGHICSLFGCSLPIQWSTRLLEFLKADVCHHFRAHFFFRAFDRSDDHNKDKIGWWRQRIYRTLQKAYRYDQG